MVLSFCEGSWVILRGTQGSAGSRFSCAGLEARIPAHHPLRKVRQVETDAPSRLDADFGRLCCARGRPSIAPERLTCASLIRVLFPVRSGCQLIGRMQHELRFRRFARPGINDPVRVPAVFAKNRDRLLTTDMSRKFLAAIPAHRKVAPQLSDEHVPVDGALVKGEPGCAIGSGTLANAPMKSFRPKDDGAPPDDDGGPGNPPAVCPDDAPGQSQPETAPMTRPARHNRNAEVVRALT